MDRRAFIASSLAACAVAAQASDPSSPRFAHRQAQMPLAPGQNVFQLAAKIPGLAGVQLQMIWKGADISQGGQASELKKQARDNGILTPSIAGIWKHGENIFAAQAAEQAIMNAIQAASQLDARVILIAMFEKNCPQMDDPASYEPAVALLRKMAPRAADADTKLCLETSLTPADDLKFIERVGHPSVRVYYDATNTETYHPGTGVAGIHILRHDIGEIHLKNGDRLLDQQPAKVNWVEAIKAYRDIHYSGWYCFETEHASPERCIEDTIANMAFVRAQLSKRS